MRGWILAFVLSGLAGCASVIGLEDAELDDRGNGGNGNGGNGNGGNGNGGNGGTPECSFEPGSNACLTECWNGRCCEAASACLFDNARRCGDYLDCVELCAGDSACEGDCGEEHSAGATLFNEWTACSLGCDCETGSDACTDASPTSCVGDTAVRVCGADGSYQTRTCAGLCRTFGLAPGPCAETECQCGAALDAECELGVGAFCTCAAAEGTPCDDQSALLAYVGCYTGDPAWEPGLRCAAGFVDTATQTVDCEGAAAVCGQ